MAEEHVLEISPNNSKTLFPAADGGDEIPGEDNPQERWLPITESRNGNALKATFHLISSGIGNQALMLPIAFVSLGWYWGIICLSLLFSWQLYTKWLLVNLHESEIRYSRYLQLSMAAFGEKLAKFLALFPTMYLSSGTCIIFIITGGSFIELLFQAMCDEDSSCEEKTLTGAQSWADDTQWFFLFNFLAIFTAQFFPNLDSVAPLSLVGSIMAVFYCSLLWVMSVEKGRVMQNSSPLRDGYDSGFRHVLNGFAIIALAFRGHNLVIEIQGTIPNQKQPSSKPMWRGMTISSILVALCMYPLAIVGHWAYENKVSLTFGILPAFVRFHQKSTSKYITGAICLAVLIHYLCAYQIYAMPAFDNFERIYTTKKNKPCPRWVRSAIKAFFGGFTYFISVALPFLPRLGLFVGSLVLPLTLVYPCLIWLAVKKPTRFSSMWCLNVGLGSFGVLFCLVCGVGAMWSLVVDGLNANFFNPK